PTLMHPLFRSLRSRRHSRPLLPAPLPRVGLPHQLPRLAPLTPPCRLLRPAPLTLSSLLPPLAPLPLPCLLLRVAPLTLGCLFPRRDHQPLERPLWLLLRNRLLLPMPRPKYP